MGACLFLAACAALLAPPASATVSIDWVPVGNPGNPADSPAPACLGSPPYTGAECGSVPYAFAISKYEVTNRQYAAFLTAVDPYEDNALGLYNESMRGILRCSSNRRACVLAGLPGGFGYLARGAFANRPVTHVSFYDALRFANWLHNGQPQEPPGPGTTETGAYTLLGGTAIPSNGTTITRTPGAFAFLPNENEWYKAAYSGPSGHYYDFPTGTDTPTICATPTATPNRANCGNAVGDWTDVGDYPGSASPYGAFDMGGNVWEWNEEPWVQLAGGGSKPRVTGGGWIQPAVSMSTSAVTVAIDPSAEEGVVGFRVATRTALPVESGTLTEEIARLDDLVLARNSNAYVTPTTTQLSSLRSLAQRIENDQLPQAASEALALGYELVLFADTRNARAYWLLRERIDPTTGKPDRGWGNYVYDPQSLDRLVEAPHPKSDLETPQLAIEVFYEAGARGYLMAGAHRLANGGSEASPTSQPANVAAHRNSMFHVFHEEWSDEDTLPIQIHGFAIANHTNFPPETKAVISNGDGLVRAPHYDLDEGLDDSGLRSFAWNEVSAADSSINCLDGTHSCQGALVQDGSLFIDVGGNYNEQGEYTRTRHNRPFLHVELTRDVRTPEADPSSPWRRAIVAVVETLQGTYEVPDEDRDGVADDDDNCPAVPNAEQADTGTIGSPSNLIGAGSDGIGDACQCGDMTGDGRVLGNDATLIRRWLIGLPVPERVDSIRCNIFGPAGPGAGECQGNDATIIRRNLIGLAPAAVLDNCFPDWSRREGPPRARASRHRAGPRAVVPRR